MGRSAWTPRRRVFRSRLPGTGSGSPHQRRWCRCRRCGTHQARSAPSGCPLRSSRLVGSKTRGLGHVPAGGHERSTHPSTPCPRSADLSLGLGQEFVGQLGAGKICDNPGVTQVFPTVARKLATTAGPAARAAGLDGMPALAEGASLDPGWDGNGTGGDWPQLGCTLLRMERQGQAQGSPGNAESASLGTATTQAWDGHRSPGSGVWGQPSTTELPCQ